MYSLSRYRVTFGKLLNFVGSSFNEFQLKGSSLHHFLALQQKLKKDFLAKPHTVL